MCNLIEEYAEKQAREAAREANKKTASRLFRKGFSRTQIKDILDLSDDELSEIEKDAMAMK